MRPKAYSRWRNWIEFYVLRQFVVNADAMDSHPDCGKNAAVPEGRLRPWRNRALTGVKARRPAMWMTRALARVRTRRQHAPSEEAYRFRTIVVRYAGPVAAPRRIVDPDQTPNRAR